MPEEETQPIRIFHVHGQRDAQLAHVGEAAGLPCLLARLRENGEQNGRENGDDGDHDEKLCESKGSARTAHRFPPEQMLRDYCIIV